MHAGCCCDELAGTHFWQALVNIVYVIHSLIGHSFGNEMKLFLYAPKNMHFCNQMFYTETFILGYLDLSD